ncbi:MAG: hypothetical protein JXR37_18845 [Kiritimatiellae bacterium]|nr:hypothetical protein [Kiritimatiellia bacterium]
MPDLKVLFGDQTEAALYKKLQRFIDAEVLVKVKRGVYARPDASLAAIAGRVVPDCYVSLGTILARHAAIGAVPARRIQAIRVGRPRVFSCALGAIEFLSIRPALFFGFTEDGGVRYATLEKAYLDACYYVWRGRRLSFDVAEDVNVERLSRDRIDAYLRRYSPPFVSFFTELCRYG